MLKLTGVFTAVLLLDEVETEVIDVIIRQFYLRRHRLQNIGVNVITQITGVITQVNGDKVITLLLRDC